MYFIKFHNGNGASSCNKRFANINLAEIDNWVVLTYYIYRFRVFK